MRAIVLTGSALVLLTGGAAAAESLDAMCRTLNESPAAACALERAARWELRTALIVDVGWHDRVERVEARFCEMARRRGVAAQVQRLNQLPDDAVGRAEIRWSCATPTVSAAPRR